MVLFDLGYRPVISTRPIFILASFILTRLGSFGPYRCESGELCGSDQRDELWSMYRVL